MAQIIMVQQDLEVWTCLECGVVYAIPEGIKAENHECPMCATRNIQEAKRAAWDARNQVREQKRIIASLRGQITKLKNQSKSK